MSPRTIYGHGGGVGDAFEEADWVVDPESARVHVGHQLTVSLYGGQNLAIECEDCCTIIGDIDYDEVAPE